MSPIGIVDYGSGNVGSIAAAFRELGVVVREVTDPNDAALFTRLVVPGVGNFQRCMSLLRETGWASTIREVEQEEKISLLGICVGMQVLFEGSAEGNRGMGFPSTPGLGLIAGQVFGLEELGCGERLPHMGWDSVRVRSTDPIFEGLPDQFDVYFVHSFAVPASLPEVIATCEYGVPFGVAVRRGKVIGIQFHPEKSSKAGLTILRNFAVN